MSFYDHIPNESTTHTMIATLRVRGMKTRTFVVPPGQKLPTYGRVQWQLWSLRWRPFVAKDREYCEHRESGS